MAIAHPSQHASTDDQSDYGSDIDDATATDLLSQADSQPLRDIALESIEESELGNGPWELRVSPSLSRLRDSLQTPAFEGPARLDKTPAFQRSRGSPLEAEKDGSSGTAVPQRNRDARNTEVESPAPSSPPQPSPNPRSPLERFRTAPKKPLSVTDLVSPAWCEQQYEYSLSKYGRVRKTPAMKQGSSVHKELEEQVHVRVPVEIVSKEDRFALRLWNMIQGVRTLRHTGLTRELEVCGIVDDQVVIGIIDQITTSCPDEEMEARIREGLDAKRMVGGRKKSGKTDDNDPPPPEQRTLNDFLTSSSQGGGVLEDEPAFLGTLRDTPRTFYLVDIKTRQSKSLPSAGSPSRPTHMQLMLYHRLLSALAAHKVPASKIFERYSLDPEARFSDKFIAELANLDIRSVASVDEDDGFSNPSSDPDPLVELLEHNTLNSLWSLLISELALTLPSVHDSQNPSISPLLTAEFRTGRSSNDVKAGTLLGRRSFAFDGEMIDSYLRDEMSWWKGARETKGVEIEEAYKCRICEFGEMCVWRKTKMEEGIRKARSRVESERTD